MFTVSAVLLTAVQSVRPVFQSIRAEKQSSAFTQSVDSGQLSGSVALAEVCQDLVNPTDCLLTQNTLNSLNQTFISLCGNALNKAIVSELVIKMQHLY